VFPPAAAFHSHLQQKRVSATATDTESDETNLSSKKENLLIELSDCEPKGGKKSSRAAKDAAGNGRKPERHPIGQAMSQ
jgi:hypothetical protein